MLVYAHTYRARERMRSTACRTGACIRSYIQRERDDDDHSVYCFAKGQPLGACRTGACTHSYPQRERERERERQNDDDHSVYCFAQGQPLGGPERETERYTETYTERYIERYTERYTRATLEHARIHTHWLANSHTHAGRDDIQLCVA